MSKQLGSFVKIRPESSQVADVDNCRLQAELSPSASCQVDESSLQLSFIRLKSCRLAQSVL